MSRMNLDTAIRLSAQVKGANTVQAFSRDLKGLDQAAKVSKAELGRMNIAINQMARSAGNTTASLRQHVAALQTLRDRVEIGGKAYNRLGNEIDQLQRKLRSLDGATTASAGNLRQQIGSALAAAGAGRLAGGALQSSVAIIESERRLRSLSTGLDDYTQVQQKATSAAQRFGITQTQANQEFAQIYARLRPVGLTLEQVSTVYNGFNTAAKLSGTTAAEASSAFLQLSQALGTGVLRGQELNSVFEQTPGVVQAIAQVMGVPVGQIRTLAEQGRITADIVLTALGKIEKEGAPKLAEAMKGPAQQFRQLAIEGDRLQQQLGEAMLPVALQLTRSATGLLQEASKLPEPIKDVGAAAAATGIAVGSLALAMNAIGGVSAATAALKAYTASATAAGTASAAAAAQARGLAGIVGTLGKIGLITIGVKFAVEGLDELITGLVGVQDAENASRAMAERRGLTYTPSAAVQRRNRAASGYVSPFAGARDRAFELARQIQPGQTRPGGGGSGGGGGASAGGSSGGSSAASSKPSIEDRIAARPFGRQIIAAARANGVDPALFAALVEQESGNRQTAISRSGAIGLAQLMPGTARELGVNPRDPMQNLMGGARYLRQQLDRFGLEGGLRAYNQGPGAQQRTPGGNSRESREYPGLVLGRYRNLTGREGNIEELQAEGIENQIESAERMRDQLKAADEQNAKLKDQLALVQETNRWKQAELEYDIKKNEIAREYDELKKNAASAEELTLINANQQIEARIAQLDYEQQLNQLYAEREELMANITRAAAMPTVYNELETQQAALDAVLEKYPAIGAAADAAANLATAGVREMIAGTKTAEQVFVDFLTAIADALIDTAKQMIAQYIAIGIARMFAGVGSQTGQNFTPVDSLPSAGSFNPIQSSFALPGRAIGGPTMAGRPYKVGENGPELFVPYQSGTIIPADKTEQVMTPMILPINGRVAAMGNSSTSSAVPFLKSGDSSQLVVPFQKGGADAGDGSTSSNVIDVEVKTVMINQVEYATVDQLRAATKQAATQGAELAHKRYVNNPSRRRQAGF